MVETDELLSQTNTGNIESAEQELEEYDEILGVHICGPRATEAIAEACVALGAEATGKWYGSIMHAHPTLSETVQESLHQLMGHAIHI